MKTSVISPEFRKRYLGNGDTFRMPRSRVRRLHGLPRNAINDPALGIDENTILVIRGSGAPWAGPAPPRWSTCSRRTRLLKARNHESFRRSAMAGSRETSDSPSILNCSPEKRGGWRTRVAAEPGDIIRIDLAAGTCDMLVSG